ncbi:MAG: alpha/beta hydrolase [Bacteroidia bacterium]|nr:alpha/beta hydrolase [Bacteroidia bacterium]
MRQPLQSKPENPPLVLYAIPGLGVDGRIFAALERFLPLQVLEWMFPTEQEGLNGYAIRMANRLPAGPVYLIGYSFGGVVAQEIARQRAEVSVILISSIRFHEEKPLWLKLAKYVPFYRLAQGSWRVRSLPLWSWKFGVTKAEEIRLLQAMFSTADDGLRMWSIRRLSEWEGARNVPLFLRIHGDGDHVFRVRHFSGDMIKISGGNHMMIWQQAEEVAGVIREKIEKSDRHGRPPADQ